MLHHPSAVSAVHIGPRSGLLSSSTSAAKHNGRLLLSMTLIAAYWEHNTPVLIGDVLTSIATPDGLLPAGARKKLVRLGSSVAVGFSGSVDAAEQLFTHLTSHIGSSAIDITQLERLMAGYDVRALPGDLSVLGWAAIPELTCFRWDSKTPQQFSIASRHYAGSGISMAESLLGRSRPGFVEGLNPSPDTAIKNALSITCNLIAREELGAPFRLQGFGKAYEIIVWDGTQFTYVDDVIYLLLDIEVDNGGRSTDINLLPVVFKYVTLGEFAVFQTSRLADNTVRRDIFTPPLQLPPDVSPAVARTILARDYAPLALAARNRALFVRLQERASPSGPEIPPLTIVFREGDPNPPIRFEYLPASPSDLTNGIFKVNVNTAFVEWAAALILQDFSSDGRQI